MDDGFLQPEPLNELWHRILTVVNSTAGLLHFRDPQLFFTAKESNANSKPRIQGVLFQI